MINYIIRILNTERICITRNGYVKHRTDMYIYYRSVILYIYTYIPVLCYTYPFRVIHIRSVLSILIIGASLSEHHLVDSTPALSIYIIILDRCRASRERSERDPSDRMAFWPAQLNAALRCMANSITVLWLS